MVGSTKKSPKRVLTLMLILVVMLTAIIPASVNAYGPLTMYTPASGDPNPGCQYARAVQLKYSGSNNGKMYATFESYVNGTPTFKIFESTNNGQSWAKVGDVTDKVNGWGMRYQPFLFEMPQTIGSLTAGTLLCVGNSIPGDMSKTKIDLYKSTDLGRTWTFVSSIASGGAASMGSDPIWEPFLMVANNKLICYYSDERDSAHSQKLVYQTSTNGTAWGSVVDAVALSNSAARPGMAVVAKMPNGQYIMTYEIMGTSNNGSYYQISSNPESWNVTSSGTKIDGGGSPYVVTLPNGKVVMASAGTGNVYVNAANGAGGWSNVPTPLAAGYTRGLVPLSNGRLFVIRGGTWSGPNTVTYADVEVGGNYSISAVANPGFEDNGAKSTEPKGWFVNTYGSPGIVFSDNANTHHSGSWHLGITKNAAHQAWVGQMVGGLANGTYTLKAWVISSGGQSQKFMYANHHGGSQVQVNIPTTGTWTQITLSNINVTSGQCEIGFYENAAANDWMAIDDVTFTKN